MKTVIEMAREAGATEVDTVDPQCWIGSIAFESYELEAFAELVRADEREACAKAADDQWVRNPNVSGGDAIRARSNT